MIEYKHIDLSCSKKTLGSFKKCIRSKLLIFDPPLLWLIPVHFTCKPFSTYIRFSELPQTPLKKSSAVLMNF